MIFKPHAKSEAEARKRSAVLLFEYLLAEIKPAVWLRHRQELLNALLWKITEAEAPKLETRFQSLGASIGSDEVKMRHDHVYQRSKMLAKLEKPRAHKVDSILKKPFGCTVTPKEHNRLAEFAKKYDG
jgi:hypothetical protein